MPLDSGAGADADPIVARYNVFLKPQLPEHQKLLVLQYPNRIDKNGNTAGGGAGSPQTPTELRVKKGSGMVEVDVPLDYTTAYDRTKGVAWGSALATSTRAKAGGSHGLAGGFGVGGQQGNGRNGGGARGGGGGGAAAAAAAASATIIEDDGGGARAFTSSNDWAEAVRQDRVLRMQTLGGMCPPARIAEAKWMIGVFDGGNVHLTPVSSMVHLRPQLHHIDAETEVERAKHRDTGAGGGDGAGGAGAGAGAGGARGAGGPRAIHMTVKSAGADGEEIITETMADRLRGVQMENWSRMVYVGDDDEHSWDVYDQTLFLKDPVPAAAAAADDGDDTEKAMKDIAAAAAAAAEAGAGSASLRAKVPSLRTTWNEDDMLVAISKVERPADDDVPVKLEARTAAGTGKDKGKGKGRVTFAEPAGEASSSAAPAAAEVKAEADAQAAQARMRPLARPAASLTAAGAAPSTRGRGARARQASAKGSAMDIDP